MNKEFIPYEQALELKKLGFDESCFAIYKNNNHELQLMPTSLVRPRTPHTDAPTFSQAFSWFREKHGIISFIDYTYYDGMHYGFKWVKPNGDYGEDWKDNDDDCKGWDTYEEAEVACLRELIELVKTQS